MTPASPRGSRQGTTSASTGATRTATREGPAACESLRSMPGSAGGSTES